MDATQVTELVKEACLTATCRYRSTVAITWW